jgi:hypothetical protein
MSPYNQAFTQIGKKKTKCNKKSKRFLQHHTQSGLHTYWKGTNKQIIKKINGNGVLAEWLEERIGQAGAVSC